MCRIKSVVSIRFVLAMELAVSTLFVTAGCHQTQPQPGRPQIRESKLGPNVMGRLTPVRREERPPATAVRVPPQPAGAPTQSECCSMGEFLDVFQEDQFFLGNAITVTENVILVEFGMELDFVSVAPETLTFAVYRRNVAMGTYEPVAIFTRDFVGVGQAFYGTGAVSIPLFPDTAGAGQYAIGVGWNGPDVEFGRDDASYPQAGCQDMILGSWGFASAPPAPGDPDPLPIGALFQGAVLSMELCLPPPGACCLPGASCVLKPAEAECVSSNGVFAGHGVSCSSDDCNSNGFGDVCDIAVGTSPDCNSNGVPDECDLTGATSKDCQPNGVPDECELDCNTNGVQDACDIAAGTSEDCNTDGIPDECVVASGDECEQCIAVCEGTFEGTTADNTGTTGDDTTCSTGDLIDEWYCYMATCTGTATASTCGSSYDTTLAVFDACGGAQLACNNDFCGRQSQVQWPVSEGVTYFARVSGFAGTSGDYTLDIICDDPCPASTNSCCTASKNGTPGCEDATCCRSVCSIDPNCCNAVWNNYCRDLAFLDPNCTCPTDCGSPTAGDCCAEHATPACSDADCCASVCAFEPTCCSVQWHSYCVLLANSALTNCTCPPPPDFCEGSHAGDCCSINEAPYCEDNACCNAVCAIDDYCCETAWDHVCAFVAMGEPSCASCPCTDGDLDRDHDVDLKDLAEFMLCFGGDGSETCKCADLNQDGNVDLADDFSAFNSLVAGPRP